MTGLTTDTFKRPSDVTDETNPAALYVSSYLLIRTVVGIIGIVLPAFFIIGEAFYLRGGVHVRGSISAYYHTSMHDIFVAGLCVIGFLLATYMAGLTKTWDFWLSFVAGGAVLVVAFFPTRRPSLADDAPLCGTTPMPDGCAPIQQVLGENLTAVIHFAGAGIFIACLAAISFLFGRREAKYTHNAAMANFQRLCGWAIIAALAWILLGLVVDLTIGEITSLYLGEVVAVWAFGASWLSKGKDLRGILTFGLLEPRPADKLPVEPPAEPVGEG